jgi:MoaA/NifB/PqqE/SkfB family radical SAM enzyme
VLGREKMPGPSFKDVARLATSGLLQRYRPLLAQMVVTRYCNLDCGYCNEFDKVSKPVPTAELMRRIDKLAELKTVVLTMTGGEPLTHPDLPALVAHARSRGLVVSSITNGFLLTREWIEKLNEAGLQGLQISIDGIKPDEVSIKTLKSLRGKLDLLAEYAEFPVNINSVMGISEERTADAIEIRDLAIKLGFSHTVGVVHEGDGTLIPLSETQRDVYGRVIREGGIAHKFNYRLFQRNLTEGLPNDWKCRAGSRYLYICEFGLVHYCSQRRGEPGIPLLEYGRPDIKREFHTVKSCAPYCTLTCVHHVSTFDGLREAAGPVV